MVASAGPLPLPSTPQQNSRMGGDFWERRALRQAIPCPSDAPPSWRTGAGRALRNKQQAEGDRGAICQGTWTPPIL